MEVWVAFANVRLNTVAFSQAPRLHPSRLIGSQKIGSPGDLSPLWLLLNFRLGSNLGPLAAEYRDET